MTPHRLPGPHPPSTWQPEIETAACTWPPPASRSRARGWYPRGTLSGWTPAIGWG